MACETDFLSSIWILRLANLDQRLYNQHHTITETARLFLNRPNMFVALVLLIRFNLTDSTGRDVDFAIWSGLECSIATLCACVPTMRPLLIYVRDSRPVSATITKLGSNSYLFGSRRSSTEKQLNSVKIPRQNSWKAVYGERSVEIRSLANAEKSEGGIAESDLEELRALTASRAGDDKAIWADPSGIRVQTELEVTYDKAASRRASQSPAESV